MFSLQIFRWTNGPPVTFQKHFSTKTQNHKYVFYRVAKKSGLKLVQRELNLSNLLDMAGRHTPYKHWKLIDNNTVGTQFVGWTRCPVYNDNYFNKFTNSTQILMSYLDHISIHINSCGLMLITNLALPEWLAVSCDVPYLPDILCARKYEHKQQNFTQLSIKSCSQHQLKMGSSCYSIVWNNGTNTGICNCSSEYLNPVHLANISKLHFMMEALHLSPLLSVLSSCTVILCYDTILSAYVPTLVTQNPVKGYQLFSSNERDIFVGGNIQRCETGSYISILGHCTIEKLSDKQPLLMEQAASYSQYPLSQFTKANFTLEFVRPRKANYSDVEQDFACLNGRRLYPFLVNDLSMDCPPSGEDENILHNLMKHNVKYHCGDPNQQPCQQGHTECYNFAQVCTYRINSNYHLMPCRNGAHLTSCRSFECNMMFKCWDNYCVPWEYVCNSRWDCPEGEDEGTTCEYTNTCQNGFKCRNTKSVCIHVEQLCDNMQNCPLGDDEELCVLQGVICPQGCSCWIYVLVCKQSFVVTQNKYPFKYVVLSQVRSLQSEQLSKLFQGLTVVNISRCSFSRVCLLHLIYVSYIDATQNNFKEISKHCFENSSELWNVQLVHDHIVSILPESFAHLPSLRILNLSFNSFYIFPKSTLHSSHQLMILSLIGITLSHIDSESLNLPKLGLVESFSSQICCALQSQSKCALLLERQANCESFLSDTLLRVFYFVVTLVVLLLNGCSIAAHIWFYEIKECLTILVVCTNTSEILWGLYLTCLLITNYIFPGYSFSDMSLWQSSFLCYFSSTMAVSSTIVSPVFLSLLSICRMSVTVYPFDSKYLDKHFVLKLSKFVFAICGLLAVSIALVYLFIVGHLPSVTCLPFVSADTQVYVVIFVLFCSCVIQISALICMCASNYKTWTTVCASNRKTGQSKPHVFMITQWIMISGSCLLSWITSSAIYMVILFTSGHPTRLIMWTSVTVSSLKPLVHPVVLVCALKRSLGK